MQKGKLNLLRERVMSFLESRSYKQGSFKMYNRTYNELADFMEREKMTDYDESVGYQFLQYRFGDRDYNALTIREKLRYRHIDALNQLLKSNEVKARTLKNPYKFDGEKGYAFRFFLKDLETTGRKSASIRRNEVRLYDLYKYWMSANLDAKTFGLQEGILYIQKLDKELTTGGREEAITKVRAFLFYMCEHKWLADNNMEHWRELFKHRFIKSPQIPSVYTPQEIEAIINAIDRTTSKGKRDYAIILLGARYGLRNSDIRGLRFCNLDWENNRLCFAQQKTGKRITLPLSEEVGMAIIDYIQHSRPKVDLPYVFLSFKTPYNPLDKNIVANTIIEWMRNAGVDFAKRRHGSHILRHSLATNLLSNEVTLPVISETLGHSNTQITTAYLRVSVDLLRQCALDVPFIPTSICDNLYGESK